ncbi:MAG: sigma 54-interacting transcriptional regulator, partial [Desulfobacterales bacterium]
MISKYLKDIRKLPRFHISLYVIVPFIIMGFTVLAALVALNFSQVHAKTAAFSPVFWATALVAVTAFAAGVFMMRFILKPVERFVRNARQFTPHEENDRAEASKGSGDQIQQFTQVFDQVTSVLSRLESRSYFPKIIGESRPMRGLMSLIMKVSPTDSTVLILGESGTGKELVATSIYDQGLRKDKPFIKLNCAAIPEELLESELF